MMTTPSTINFEPGAVVRVNMLFTTGAAAKVRPVIVLSDARYHTSRQDALVLGVTGSVFASYFGDCEIVDWKAAGLAKESKAKGVIQTIDRGSVDYQYGKLTDADWNRIRESLRLILDL